MLEPRILLDAAVIQGIVDQVTEVSYADYLTVLGSYDDRNSYTENIGAAAAYIAAELTAMGLDVELQTFALPSLVPIEWNGGEYWAPVSNIIATLPGTVTPEQEYVLTAHYDSMGVHPDDYADLLVMLVDMFSPSSPAPGVDDNASGTSAVLEAARVLSQYPFESTIKFILFAAEEQGMVGSDYYSRYAYYDDASVDAWSAAWDDPLRNELLVPDPDNILGAINYDMIAYWDGDPAGGETLNIFGYTGPTHGILDYPNLEEIITTQNPNLTPEQVLYVLASLTAAIPDPPATSVNSDLLASTFVDAADTYGTGLNVEYVVGGTAEEWWLTGATSDHFNFWWYGWPALLAIEDMVYGIDADGMPFSTVTNPHYHSVGDNLANANATGMATAATKTGVAAFAELAGLRIGVLNGDFNSATSLSVYGTEGIVTLESVGPGDNAAQLSEGSDAALWQELVIPLDAGMLSFDYRFVNVGDGDYLTVTFDGVELFSLLGTDTDTNWHTVEIDVSSYAGEPGTLVLRLNGVDLANAQCQIDNVAFVAAAVNEAPVVTSLTDSPDPVVTGQDLTLAAVAEDADGTVAQVEFYRDTNGTAGWQADDQVLGADTSPAGGWTWMGSTAGWELGQQTYFARALDDDGAWSDPFSTTGTIVRFATVASHQYADGVMVTIYDIDSSNGASAPDIAWSPAEYVAGVTDVLVDPGSIGDGVIDSVQLYGDGTQTGDLGIVVEDNAGLGQFEDLRTGTPPLGFLVSEADVDAARAKAGIAGADINGWTTAGGWMLPADIDGDGDTDDLTGLYTPGSLGSLRARDDIDGDIVVGGDLGVLSLLGADLNGDLAVGGKIGRATVRATKDRATHLWVGGYVSGDIAAGGGLKRLTVSGDLSGSIGVIGDLSCVSVKGNVVGSTIDVDGLFRALDVGGDFYNSSVDAGALGRVVVGGLISEDGSDGDVDEIHAYSASFSIKDATWRGRISATKEHTFSGVRAWVG